MGQCQAVEVPIKRVTGLLRVIEDCSAMVPDSLPGDRVALAAKRTPLDLPSVIDVQSDNSQGRSRSSLGGVDLGKRM